MKHNAKSIRTFIGAKDYEESRQFYREMNFEEVPISKDMSFFRIDNLGFYLQDYYVKDWVDNSMVFLEVDDLDGYFAKIRDLGLHRKYEFVRLSEIQDNDWGREFFMHDPSGVLWHIGEFY